MRLMAAALMAALWLTAPAAANELSIATAGPRSGPQSMFGITWQNGMQMYVDEVNAAGGVKGRTVALVAHDDKADPNEGVLVARKLCDDPATLAVIGHFNSDLRNFEAVVDSAAAASLARALYYVLPNFAAFDVKTQVVYALPVPLSYVATSVAYGLVYIGLLISAAVLIFARRDFK